MPRGGGDLATLLADTGSAANFYTDATATAASETYSYAVIAPARRGEEPPVQPGHGGFFRRPRPTGWPPPQPTTPSP